MLLASSSTKNNTNVRKVSRQMPPLLRAGLGWLGGTFPETTTKIAYSLFTSPRRHPRPKREQATLEGACAIRIPTGSGPLAGWVWGRGPTVLLVHGWEGRGSQLGHLVAPLLAAGFSVATFDAPGHGETSGRRSNVLAFADAIQAAARALGPLHAVVAHSMGAAATLYAMTADTQLPRLVLVAPADASKAVPRFTRFMGFGEAVKAGLEQGLNDKLGVSPARLSGPALASRINAPMLVIHDRSDKMVPYSDGVRIASKAPNGQIIATTGLGHHRILRDPQVINDIADFIRR